MKTGYEVSLRDFKQLLEYPAHREEVGALIREWFGYEVEPTADSFVVRDSSGAEVSVEAVHEATQSDPDRQGRLYRTAMTLWH